MKTQKIKSGNENNVLIVDDDVFVSTLIEKILINAEFKNIKKASNGKDALSALGIFPEIEATDDNSQNNTPDLVIVDIVLPDMNGFEICRKIRNAGLDIPVILVSGYDIDEIDSKIVESGADDFLKKPFNPTELVTRIKLLLSRLERKHDYKLKRITELKVKINHSVPYIGDDINGYVILDSLGWGKYSLVYKVVKANEKDVFALKMLSKSAASKIDVAKRFEHEIVIMSKIKHPNIVELIDHGSFNDCPYLVMEYISGVDLEEFMITRGKVALDTFCHIAYDIADAVCEMHNLNIFHRDIKLKNIMIDIKSGEVKLSDFGIAKIPESTNITQVGYIVGTPIYMAPEIFQGATASAQTDIYSYGATLYHLLTGSPPFVADNSLDLYKKHKNDKPAPINSFRADASEAWNNLIIDRCLAKDPLLRPKSMCEIKKEIKTLASK